MYRETGFAGWRRYLSLAVPVVLSLVGNEVYNYVFWGTLNPASNMSNAGNGPFQVPLDKGFLGVMFDRQVGLISNFPIFVLVLTGLLLSLNRARLWMHTVIMAVVLPYLLLICTFSAWWAGYSPAARYIVVVLPVLAVYLGYALQRIDSVLLICAAVVVGIATYALSITSDIFPAERFANYGNHNYGMDRLGRLFGVRVAPHVPSAFENSYPLFLTWLAVVLAVAVALWGWGLFRPRLAGGDWTPAVRYPRWRPTDDAKPVTDAKPAATKAVAAEPVAEAVADGPTEAVEPVTAAESAAPDVP
jgi:hypothetical protein